MSVSFKAGQSSKKLDLFLEAKEEDINKYIEAAGDIFKILKEAIEQKKVEKMLKGPIAHSGFQRLT